MSDQVHGTRVSGTGALVGGLGGVAGYGEGSIYRNDDGYSRIDVSSVFENGINIGGTVYSHLYINTNGSVSFGNGVGTYTPRAISSDSAVPLIAPFWADVDTRNTDAAPVYYDFDTTADVFTVTWAGVGYYSHNVDQLNSFQLQLYDRGEGDFDIVFRYQDINWTTGDASGGSGGLGGTPARAGYTIGGCTSYFELPQSGNQTSLLNLEATTGNTDVTGLWHFEVREGSSNLGTGKSASQIFSDGGMLSFFAELAAAAYHLGGHERAATGYNEEPFNGTAHFANVSSNIQLLSAADLADPDVPSLVPTSSGNYYFPKTGLCNGIYVRENAAALIGRSTDALFISFRGTNDNGADAGTTPDKDDWLNMERHYEHFRDLITALDEYVSNEGILQVYVTGHSLGAAMVEAYMREHTGEMYEAVTFASPGYGFNPFGDRDDARITNLWLDGDAITNASAVQINYGDKNTIYHNLDDDDVPDGVSSGHLLHSVELYYDYANYLNEHGIDVALLTGNYNGVDYDNIYANFQINNHAAGDYSVGTDTDSLEGSSSSDILLGGAGNDRLTGGGARDYLHGGDGTDTAVYTINSSEAVIFMFSNQVAIFAGSDGNDELVSIEQLEFTDGVYSLSIAQTFSAMEYIASYADLMDALGTNSDSGFQHFLAYGYDEGRRSTFSGLDYIASNSDLISYFGANAEEGTAHYINYGRHEDRQVTFNSLNYIASNADLISAYGANAEAGSTHYIEYGFDEGRQVTFSGLNYIASYADLIDVYGTDADAGSAHYIEYGHNEGRHIFFSGLHYIASHNDLIEAFGADTDAATLHYVSYGFSEGRDADFDVRQYLANNADLMTHFQNDYTAAVEHYVTSGASEGRVWYNGLEYIASHTDLMAALGADMQAGLAHYVNWGRSEGRGQTFDGLEYIASHADLIRTFGVNENAGASHYINYGRFEGRETTFDAVDYLRVNSDLADFYGSDLEAATMHYINWGFDEGRAIA